MSRLNLIEQEVSIPTNTRTYPPPDFGAASWGELHIAPTPGMIPVAALMTTDGRVLASFRSWEAAEVARDLLNDHIIGCVAHSVAGALRESFPLRDRLHV